jgi:hypothetical protein
MKFKIKLKDGKDKEKRFCIKCGREIKGAKKKFCNDICRTRYHSLLRYNKLKDTPAYKKRRKIYHREWREANRERFNTMMRIPARNYYRKKSQEKKLERENAKK